MMKTNIDVVLSYLDEIFPNACCELEYTTDYSFLIAVMLSAQTTDKSVNNVTRILFKKYPTLEDLNNASEEDIKEVIKSIGLAKNKAKNIKGIVYSLKENFNGKVPEQMDSLLTLPGVGIKTANVVRCELFHIPSVPVDTHVERIAKRLNLASKRDNPIDVEKRLEKLIKKDRQIKAHHQFIHFGRYFCKAQNPNCKNCEIIEFCKEKHKNI